MQSNAVKIVEAYYSAFNQKNFSQMLGKLAPEVVHDLNQGKSQVGLEAFRSFMDHMNDCYDEFLEEIVLFDGGQGKVAAEFYVRGKYLKTDGGLPPAKGQAYRIRAGAFLEVKDDKITRVTTYYNLPHWIEAVKS